MEVVKIYYSGMFSKYNTHTREQVNEYIKSWDEDKLMTQFGFGWKGAKPSKITKEEAIAYKWVDAKTDNNGNLILVAYGENDYY